MSEDKSNYNVFLNLAIFIVLFIVTMVFIWISVFFPMALLALVFIYGFTAISIKYKGKMGKIVSERKFQLNFLWYIGVIIVLVSITIVLVWLSQYLPWALFALIFMYGFTAVLITYDGNRGKGSAIDVLSLNRPRFLSFVTKLNEASVEFQNELLSLKDTFQFKDEKEDIAWVEVDHGKMFAGMGKNLNPTISVLISENFECNVLTGSSSTFQTFFTVVESIFPKRGLPEIKDSKQLPVNSGFNRIDTLGYKSMVGTSRNIGTNEGHSLPVAKKSNENKKFVKVTRQYEYISGKIRIKAKIINNEQVGLLRLRMMLDIPESFRLLRVEPSDFARDGAVIKVNDLLPNEEKAVAWILEPLICGKEQIGGTISGNKASGEPFAIPITPLEVTVKCPLFVAPEKANLAIVQRIIVDLPAKSERVFYLPPSLAPREALAMVQAVISERDVSLVGTLSGTEDPEAPFNESTWYYGITKVGQKRYVIIVTIMEDDRTIRIFSACDDEAGCTGFLAEAGASLRNTLLKSGIYESEREIRELICEKCGATLNSAPRPGHNVECPECRWTWKEADFFSSA